MTKYTDEQIIEAIKRIPMMKNSGPVVKWELNMFRQFIDALPDQLDDWQECTFDEIRKGDQVKTRRRGVTSVYEHPVVSTYRSGPLGRRISLERGGFHPDSDTTFYRIPAPVQHPDPEEHPYILVFGYKTHGQHITNYSYKLLEWRGMKYEGRAHALLPEQITEWRPLKVVDHDDR